MSLNISDDDISDKLAEMYKKFILSLWIIDYRSYHSIICAKGEGAWILSEASVYNRKHSLIIVKTSYMPPLKFSTRKLK